MVGFIKRIKSFTIKRFVDSYFLDHVFITPLYIYKQRIDERQGLAYSFNLIDDTYLSNKTTEQEIRSIRGSDRKAALASKNYIMEVIDCNDTFFITFHREITRAPVGAKNDAIQSIPLFGDKSGDELNKQVNKTH